MSDRYVDGAYLARNPHWHVEDSPWKARQIARILADNGVRPRSVVEVGCGAGAILAELQKALPDARLDGYDISPQAIALARPRENERLHFHEGMPAGGTPADVMLVIDVFEHVEDPFAFLRALRGRAEHFVFHIPLDLSAQAVLRGKPIQRRRDVVGHLHYFTRETALAILAETGYTVADSRFTAGTLELPVESALARVARLPRRLLYAVAPDLAVRSLGGFSLLVLAR